MVRIYLRHSTDKQTDARQRHALAPLLKAGAPVYDDPATSSRQLSLHRAGFTKLLDEAADVVTAYQEGAAVKALARQHQVAPEAIRLTAPLALHRAALQQSAALAADTATPAARKAHRVYATRIKTAEQ
ncbi:DNA invertase Pin-like site-specific DNA recombinase [Kribbella aluminosa]|uniref:DNA invertase Pin-like site-specific DNA recombinase n=1 Tax=Kribbella aluminosa TaxID=416017 RepID=A0ABS4UMX9_9ACTN|nr:recombinase family protein [Kribbella aluminosa]MBP2352931.1 DNA invertase Pin-like site-specific DNA recombinase [Kribbella aluminosa]